jgi:hypothetical protein
MTIELTPEEKITIVEQHLKNIAYSEYNANLSLLEAQSAATPNQANVSATNAQLADILAQKAVLQSELDSLNSEIA